MSAVFQNAYYVGNNFNAIIYGIELVVYAMTIRALRHGRRTQSTSRGVSVKTFLIVFSTILLLLNTVFVVTEALFGEEMWIVHADYPGGHDAYLADFASVWYQTWGTAASILLNLLSDALLIYRCYIIWGDVRVVLFPIVHYLATFALGIAQLIASGVPHSNYFAGLAQTLGTAYTSTIISLEVIVTALICVRLLPRARGRAPEPPCSQPRVAAVFVESMLLSTLCGVAYLVPFALGSDLSVFFLSIYVMSTCLAPQLIILRIASGRACGGRADSMAIRTMSTAYGNETVLSEGSPTLAEEKDDTQLGPDKVMGDKDARTQLPTLEYIV